MWRILNCTIIIFLLCIFISFQFLSKSFIDSLFSFSFFHFSFFILLLFSPGLLFAAAGTGFLDGITSKPLEMIKLRQQVLPAIAVGGSIIGTYVLTYLHLCHNRQYDWVTFLALLATFVPLFSFTLFLFSIPFFLFFNQSE